MVCSTRIARGLAISLTATSLAMPLHAQQNQQAGFTGTWNCQTSYTEFDQNGNRTSGFVREFQLVIAPNGSFQAYGTIGSAAGYDQFQSQGGWQVENGALMVSGPEQTSNPIVMPGMTFFMVVQMQQDGSLMFAYDQPDSSQRYIMNRSNNYCQRAA